MENKMNLDTFETEWLIDITAGNPSTVEKGNRFARKLVGQWLDLNNQDEASDDVVFCDGSGDGGIDLAYLLREDEENSNEGNTWYLIQSKYGTAFQGSSTLLVEAQKLIDTLDGKRNNLSSVSKELLKRIQTFKDSASPKDKLVLVYATNKNLNDDEKRAVEDIRAMGKARLGTFFETASVSIETIYNRVIETTTFVNKNNVNITAHLVESGKELLVGSIGLVQLYDFLKDFKAKTGDLDILYEKNVRKFLGNKRKVNKGIEKTLLEKPERFGLYNNGITIVVEDFEQLPNKIQYKLLEPYVVNGCQTTRSIWGVLFNKLESGGTGTNEELEKWKEKLQQGIVVIKIVKVGVNGDELLTETTRFTNSQNAVSEKDFVALESDFQNWAKSMASTYNIFLEIQRGGWDSQKAFQKQNPGGKTYKEYVNAFDLLKVYAAAWYSEAGTAFGKNQPFAPGGNSFHRIVNQPDFGLDDLYASFLLLKASDKFKFGRGAEAKQRGQTRYLFFMLVAELLKDCFIAAGENITNKGITKAVIKLFEPNNEQALNALLDYSIAIVDDYLTLGSEYSVFKEPKFIEKGNDINSFLKWDQLGKSLEATPCLINSIAQYKIAMKGVAGQPKYKDMIKEVITASVVEENN